jgi:hypothetical protein
MRKRPVGRDEVRVHHYEVRTLPGGSFHRDGQPIARLWQPLLDTLRQQHREWWDGGPAAAPELWGEFKPRVRVVDPDTQATCRQCGRRFHHHHRHPSKWCSDLCAREARAPRIAATIAARSKARALARASRTCKTCGKPIKAQRATRQHCSVRCRVAAHRARLATTA